MRLQVIVFIILFVLGYYTANTPLFAYILHEGAHVQSAKMDKIDAEIISHNTTRVEKLTSHNLYAGYVNEFITFFLIFFILMFCSVSTVWQVGFPIGYMVGIFFYALSSTDFHYCPELYNTMSSNWILVISLILLPSILWVIIRIKSIYKESIK